MSNKEEWDGGKYWKYKESNYFDKQNVLVFKILHFPHKLLTIHSLIGQKADAPPRDRHFKLSIGIEKSRLRQSIKLSFLKI